MDRFHITSVVLMCSFLALNGFVSFALLAVIGKIHARSASELQPLITDEGPQVDGPFPALPGLDLGVYAGQEIVILFVSGGCMPCDRLLRELPAIVRGIAYRPALVIIAEPGLVSDLHARLQHRLPMMLIPDPDSSIQTALGIVRSPYGVLVDKEGIVRMKGVVDTGLRYEGLLARRGRHVSRPEWNAVENGTS